MVAGFGAYFNQQYNIPSPIGGLILSILCLLIFRNKTKGIVKVNELVIPIMIGLIILLGAISFKNNNYTSNFNESVCNSCILNPIVYASFNSITLVPILVDLNKIGNSRKNILLISILCGLILSILGYIILKLMNRHKWNR